MKAQKVQKTVLRWEPGGASGDLEIWKSGDLEIWTSRDLGICGSRDLEIWRLLETSGDFWGGTRNHPYTKNNLYHTKLPITRPWRLYW